MNRILVLLLGLLSVGCGEVIADILETKHNLTEKSNAQSQLSNDERKRLSREVCVFCHTPGGGEGDERGGERSSAQERNVQAPQWQRSVDVVLSFDLFDDIGRMGADGSAQPVGSVSVACMSCHDGLQAFGVVQGAASDHPFSVPYRGLFRLPEGSRDFLSKLTASYGDLPARMGGLTGDQADFRPARSAVINKRQIWWAAVNDSGQKTKNDLPLYPRRIEGDAGYEQVPFLECTTCHDPHSDRPVFLRTEPDQSKLCMTCHIK